MWCYVFWAKKNPSQTISLLKITFKLRFRLPPSSPFPPLAVVMQVMRPIVDIYGHNGILIGPWYDAYALEREAVEYSGKGNAIRWV